MRLSRPRLILAALTGRLPSSPVYAEELVEELRGHSPQPRLRLARDGEHFEGHGDFVVEKRAERLEVYAPHRANAGNTS